MANLHEPLDYLRFLKDHPRSLIELMRDPCKLNPELVAELNALLPDRWHETHPQCHLEIKRKTRLVGDAA